MGSLDVDGPGGRYQLIRAKLLFEKMAEDAVLPSRGHETDAGFDLYCQNDCKLGIGRIERLGTGVAIDMHDNQWAQVLGRSSTLLKGLLVSPGVIDPGYKGEILVQVMNISGHEVHIAKGQRLAQLIMMTNRNLEYEPVWGEVNQSGTRGSGGFGSTGT